MQIANGRTRQLGRGNNQSTEFWGVGKLADTVIGPDGLPVTISSSSTASTTSGCVNGYDEYGVACTDFTPITSNPVSTALALNYLNTPTAPVPQASMSTTTIMYIVGAAAFVILLLASGGRR